MSEREQPPPATDADRPRESGVTAHENGPTPHQGGATASSASPATDPTIPQYYAAPMAVKRQDPAAALLLLVAGLFAGTSLLLPWIADDDVTGLTLVKDGFAALGDGVGEVLGTGYIQPLTIVLGGGVLFLLGLALLAPARSHRAVGLVSLVIAVLVTTAVLVPLAVAGWDLGEFGIGFWFAIAVAALGLIGGAKALLARRRYGEPAAA
jgi:hypothetical protein